MWPIPHLLIVKKCKVILGHKREDDLVSQDKTRRPWLWLKDVALANFRCNGLSCDEFPFHFFIYSYLIPTQGETQIILLLDVVVSRLMDFLNKKYMPCYWTDSLSFPKICYTFRITLISQNKFLKTWHDCLSTKWWKIKKVHKMILTDYTL